MNNDANVTESCDTPQTSNKRQLDSTPSPNPSSAKQQNISSSPLGTQPEPSVPTQVPSDINIAPVHTPGRKVQLYNLDDNTVVTSRNLQTSNNITDTTPASSESVVTTESIFDSTYTTQTCTLPDSVAAAEAETVHDTTQTVQTSQTTPAQKCTLPHVSAMLEKIMEKINRIDSNVLQTNHRVAVLESEIRSLHVLNEKVCNIEDSLKFISDDYDAIKAELKQSYIDNRDLTRQVTENTAALFEAQKTIQDLQDRSMRDNLIFSNVPQTRGENCEDVVKKIIRDQIGIKEPVAFERVHRMGQMSQDERKPVSIVAKFSHFKDKERVKQNAKNLKGTRIGVYEQFSQRTNEERKILYPQYKSARQSGKYAVLRHNHLIVEDAKFFVKEGKICRDSTYNRPAPTRPNNNNNNSKVHLDQRDWPHDRPARHNDQQTFNNNGHYTGHRDNLPSDRHVNMSENVNGRWRNFDRRNTGPASAYDGR